jgi:general secretion pathway protein I
MIENRKRRRPGRGFTLIEILIAFAILAVAFAGLLRAFSSGLQATTKAERYAEAVLLARSLLERVGSEIVIQAGEQSGRGADGTAWSIRMRPLEATRAINEQDDSPFMPYEVAVTVAVPRQQPITLTTLRLVAQGTASELNGDEPEPDSPPNVDEQP